MIGMAIGNIMTGTPWHVNRYARSEGDERRHRSRCIYNSKKDSYCYYVVGKCIGAAHCMHYEEKTGNHNDGKYDDIFEGKVDSVKEKYDANSMDAPKDINNQLHIKIGDKVEHKKFGRGEVVRKVDNKITIQFDIGRNVTLDVKMCLKNKLIKIL